MQKSFLGWKRYQKWAEVSIFVLLISVAVFLRLTSYGDLRTSIGNSDTRGYLLAAKQNGLSEQFFTSNRPFTLPLVYKIFEPRGGYAVSAQSIPAARGSVSTLPLQPDYIPVVLFQHAFSITAWIFLAGTLFYHLQTMPGKILGAVLVLTFGFVPQMAQWDWLLISESLSFSLMVLLVALSIWLADDLFWAAALVRKVHWLLVAGWLVTLFLWIFTRDTNSYLVLLLLGFILLVLVVTWFRFHRVMVPLVVIGVLLISMYIFHSNTFRASGRWFGPVYHNLQSNVFPYPDRMKFFQTYGMPVIDQNLVNIQGITPVFREWMQANGLTVYPRFLIDYPLWAILTTFGDMDEMFAENLQPYYSGFTELTNWISIGNLLHARSDSIILLSLFLAVIILLLMQHFGSSSDWSLWMVGVFLFFGGIFLFFISYHGDSWGRVRHTLVGVMPLRLSVWLLASMAVDLAFRIGFHSKEEKQTSILPVSTAGEMLE